MNPYNALAWLNFFIADVRDGLGPYLGVFLKEHHFLEGQIGLISTITSLCALAFGIPLGILVDKTCYKRTLIAFCIIAITLSTLTNYFYPYFVFTLLAQLSIALCAVFLAPAFAALTLGIVGQKSYAKQVSLNEAYKHGGTAFSAFLSFGCALYWGIASIFVITVLMGIFSLLCLALLRNTPINHTIARGDSTHDIVDSMHNLIESTPHSLIQPTLSRPTKSTLQKYIDSDLTNTNPTKQIISPNTTKSILQKPILHALSFKEVFTHTHIIALSLAMFCFHLSNASMLPLLSQRAHTLGIDTSGAYAAATIIIAQSTMILVALICGKILNPSTFKNNAGHTQDSITLKVSFMLMAISLFELCVRGLVAANFENITGMIITQILDGIGAGITGVIVPILVAIILRGSGHINAGLAFVMTCGGIGGALSGSFGGFIAQSFGYFYAYMCLGSVAFIGLVVWIISIKIFRTQCA